MVNESKTKITIEFNTEKVQAMRMYLKFKDMEVETELEKTLETLYDKHVPNQVRDFILLKEDIKPKKRHNNSDEYKNSLPKDPHNSEVS